MVKPMTRKRESRAERDERIVAEAGPWFPREEEPESIGCSLDSEGDSVEECNRKYAKVKRAMSAAARILNRLRGGRKR
jgi:hypothetical protein